MTWVSEYRASALRTDASIEVFVTIRTEKPISEQKMRDLVESIQTEQVFSFQFVFSFEVGHICANNVGLYVGYNVPDVAPLRDDAREFLNQDDDHDLPKGKEWSDELIDNWVRWTLIQRAPPDVELLAPTPPEDDWDNYRGNVQAFLFQSSSGPPRMAFGHRIESSTHTLTFEKFIAPTMPLSLLPM